MFVISNIYKIKFIVSSSAASLPFKYDKRQIILHCLVVKSFEVKKVAPIALCRL